MVELNELTIGTILGLKDPFVADIVTFLLVVYVSLLFAILIRNRIRNNFIGSILFSLFFVPLFYVTLVRRLEWMSIILLVVTIFTVTAVIVDRTIFHWDSEKRHGKF